MIYTEFKELKLSQLGFGCMRFAMDPDTGEIDQAKVNAMIDQAIAAGVNYFDTAYPYLGGKSEIVMAEALSRYPRESYFIGDKFPGHSLTGPIDNIALFHVSLRKCRTDYFDFYLLHNINEWSVKFYESEEYHILPDILQMKKEGKIRHLGFSFHGGPDLLEEYLQKHEGIFEFVQIQLNYLDWTLQDARRKYEILRRHGLGIWVMEPVRGGKLAVLPEKAGALLRAQEAAAGTERRSDASYAFRFLQGLPGVNVILSGMNEMAQVEDNLRTFAEPQPLTETETAALMAAAEELKSGVPCTSCRYCCEGCPMQLDIPFLLETYNNYKFARSTPVTMRMDALADEKKPAACIGCGRCKKACPQGIDIPAVLAELTVLYEKMPHWSETVLQRAAEIEQDLRFEETCK